MKKKLAVSVSEYSDKGVKEINQDFHDVLIPKEPQLTSKGIAIALADGISSSAVSQVASKTAVTSFLSDYFSTPETWSVNKSAQRVINATNSWLYSQSKQGQYHYDKNRGYVCTLSAMVLRSTTAHIFHIGDSRIYRLRDAELELLTDDHRIWVSSEKSYLSRALGIDSHIYLDYKSFQVQENDVYLFMTDGVYEFLEEKFIISSVIDNSDSFEKIADILGKHAYANKSDDNITVQLVRVDSLPDREINEITQELTNKPFAPILSERESFDGYTIVRELSGTSRSHVYLAIDDDTNEQVVIKTPSLEFQDDKAYLERFMMEEWIAIRINNTNVAKSYLASRQRNYIYIVTEYIEGQTLTQWMIDNPNPDMESVRLMAEQIARGIQAFHRLEMIHQDLRPENVLIDKNGAVKIIDFGSTRVEGISDINSFIEQENLQGTAQYSAPEYFIGESGTASSDVFSLGVIVYQMISGKLPYGVEVARYKTKKEQRKLKYTHLYSDEKNIPIWIEETLKKALQVNPYYRYNELSEFIYDLRHPNSEFLKNSRPPLLERNPLLLWKSISFILTLIIFVLITK
ncbi:protein kinase [Sulfurimonas aquatica]|uniref:Protein kinase n=1 Tax=Sulfurimonas aquatica TaxID=2672570 RepID=A0A975GCS4_9BACT|nr:bifunctional protein-serine/threonine kinase/phosphatase [Sulfurimonas aquatica]QSZ41618.1 protein kinase [Sulfurimonas aquatica]